LQDIQRKARIMTMQHTMIGTFTATFTDMLADIARASAQRAALKQRKARVATHIKALSALEPRLLDDIGLKGFDRLTPDAQESLLLGQIQC
jgi:hypothetical protein